MIERREDPTDLNVYASRRGNWEVMLRGLFTNLTVVNHLGPDLRAGLTVFAPTGDRCRSGAPRRPTPRPASRWCWWRASARASAPRATGPPRARTYWARAVLANSFERIHRANLVCMGVLPLRMPDA